MTDLRSAAMQNYRRFASLLIGAALATGFAAGAGRMAAQPKSGWSEQMDEASKRFTSAQADLRQELFTKIVQDTEKQNGEIYFKRSGAATDMGMKMYPPDALPGTPPVQVVEFKNSTLRVFNPGTNHVDAFSASGKNAATAQALLAIGFGGSAQDLKAAWTVTDLGAETLKDGTQTVATEKLDLVSKNPEIQKTYTHIAIWVDPARAVTLKQVFYAASDGKPSGDTRTVYFSNIRLNKPVDTAPFAIKCKGNKCN
jgi:outer membrane lipoprotein-sorting protein